MLSAETRRFFNALRDNNNREWFEANKAWYQDAVKAPAEIFVEALRHIIEEATGVALKPKIFRVHRDVRFARDKTPYNAHLHMSFTAEDGFAPGWLVGLDAEKLVLGCGTFAFEDGKLDHWRRLADEAEGEALAEILADFVARGIRVDDPELKRVPAPYAPQHPRADLLRRKGLVVWCDRVSMEELYGAEGPARCWSRLQPFSPVFEWLRLEGGE